MTVEEFFTKYMADHPTWALVFMGVAYWVRHELGRRNGNNVPELMRINNAKLDVVAQEINLHRLNVASKHDRTLEALERVERKIDRGMICPMKKEA